MEESYRRELERTTGARTDVDMFAVIADIADRLQYAEGLFNSRPDWFERCVASPR